jgi:hypothetical protein
MRALLLVLLVACAAPPPRVHVQVIAAEREQGYLDGANAWYEFGARASWDASELPECAHVLDVDCQITVNIERIDLGFDAGADRAGRRVVIHPRFVNYYALLYLATHEFGHILLDTPEHTPDGVRAVMARRGAEWSLQPADYELACRVTGICPEKK